MKPTLDDSFLLSLPTDFDIVVSRLFDASPALVFDAWTKPEHVLRWWGCGLMTMPVCEIDLRVGGAWRFVLRMPDGTEHGFHGVYREITPGKRLEYTYVYEPMPNHEAVVTVTFEERDGKTLLSERCRHRTTEDRDGHLAAGMEEGAVEAMNRLAELLDELQEKGIAS